MKTNRKVNDKIKNKLIAKVPILKGDYNFIDIKNMPSDRYISKSISLEEDNWATTGEFSKDTHNHCAAVASTNLALYYAYQGYINLLTDTSKDATFYKVHGNIGNGPVIRIAEKTREYFKVRGYNLYYRHVYFYKGIKEAIDKDRPCAVLITAGIAKWHWVIAVGYREYMNGEKYIQIINGWKNSSKQFFKIGGGARIISAAKYWIE